MNKEINMAIMMADLSGYTAMTEIHGAFSAAEMVNRYLDMAQSALYGKTRLVERTGDELMFVSPSANDMLQTALQLLQHSLPERNFLPLHAGLHFGPVLQQNKSFFGTAVNATARVASAAGKQQLLCTATFIGQIQPSPKFSFQNWRFLELKNLLHPIGVAELVPAEYSQMQDLPVDPVCRMQVDPETTVSVRLQERTYYFCSEDCLHVFTQQQTALLPDHQV